VSLKGTIFGVLVGVKRKGRVMRIEQGRGFRKWMKTEKRAFER
jgi:hypothetical protein